MLGVSSTFADLFLELSSTDSTSLRLSSSDASLLLRSPTLSPTRETTYVRKDNDRQRNECMLINLTFSSRRSERMQPDEIDGYDALTFVALRFLSSLLEYLGVLILLCDLAGTGRTTRFESSPLGRKGTVRPSAESRRESVESTEADARFTPSTFSRSCRQVYSNSRTSLALSSFSFSSRTPADLLRLRSSSATRREQGPHDPLEDLSTTDLKEVRPASSYQFRSFPVSRWP